MELLWFEGALMLFGRKVKAEDFEAAALPHLNSLFRTAGRLIGNRGEAEDLVQEVYLQAWKSFHRFEPGTNCRAWLFKILLYKISHYRRKQLRLVTNDVEILEDVAYEPGVPEHLRDEEVLMGLEKIPEYYREAILLADVEEFSYQEIASMLNVPIGTVMSRLSRGRKLLRIELAVVAESYGIKSARKEARGGESV